MLALCDVLYYFCIAKVIRQNTLKLIDMNTAIINEAIEDAILKSIDGYEGNFSLDIEMAHGSLLMQMWQLIAVMCSPMTKMAMK